MEILKVKIQGQGYLLNGIMYVPKADGNKEYEAVKQWLAKGNVPEPEFTDEEIQEQEQAQFRAERNQLLIEADIEINKLDDLNKDASSWRVYRQALRDSTECWALPTKPEEVLNINVSE